MTQVEISIYARNLKNVAGFGKGKSDPYAIVTFGDTQLGKTEVIKNCLSPTWVTTFRTDYTPQLELALKVQIMDAVSSKGKDKPMGSAQLELGDMFNGEGHTEQKDLKEGGSIFVRVTKIASFDRGTLSMSLRGVKLANVQTFSKSDPFFEILVPISAVTGPKIWHPVYRSEVIMNDLKPVWKEAQISIETLCGGNLDRPIRIQVYDWEKSGKHDKMGTIQITVKSFLSAVITNTVLQLVHDRRRFGTLMLTKAEISGEELDPNNQPPKFKTVNGVRNYNPAYQKWQAKYGGAGTKQNTPKSPKKFRYVAP